MAGGGRKERKVRERRGILDDRGRAVGGVRRAMMFAAERPKEGEGRSKSVSRWLVDRQRDGWGRHMLPLSRPERLLSVEDIAGTLLFASCRLMASDPQGSLGFRASQDRRRRERRRRGGWEKRDRFAPTILENLAMDCPEECLLVLYYGCVEPIPAIRCPMTQKDSFSAPRPGCAVKEAREMRTQDLGASHHGAAAIEIVNLLANDCADMGI
ncbi:hypothetical protein BXZ70DRAFT_907444 [Cristinia sonorae]|uniref:Uncharacterized protein n=1 Tax=Cristinia sonorae TaxID=1940300 RepID=A0A8K0UP26_9AGAR|nr:hypothetical protein BXZ70DRAFT_907444 [Cristinia sonorae]